MAGVGGLVSLEEINRSPKQAWALNSNALKHIRDMNEEDGTPTTIKVDLFSDDPFDILTLRKGKGMEYELVPPRKPWSWRGMLNALRDDTKKVIVGEGVTDIWCAPLHGSYDHKRSHAFKKTGKPIPQGPLPIWDFFVRRGDGAVHRFHPSMTNTKVGYNMVDDNDTYPTVPQTKGRGNSDGRGTYRSFVNASYDSIGHGSGLPPPAKAKGLGAPPPPPAPAVGGKPPPPPAAVAAKLPPHDWPVAPPAMPVAAVVGATPTPPPPAPSPLPGLDQAPPPPPVAKPDTFATRGGMPAQAATAMAAAATAATPATPVTPPPLEPAATVVTVAQTPAQTAPTAPTATAPTPSYYEQPWRQTASRWEIRGAEGAEGPGYGWSYVDASSGSHGDGWRRSYYQQGPHQAAASSGSHGGGGSSSDAEPGGGGDGTRGGGGWSWSNSAWAGN